MYAGKLDFTSDQRAFQREIESTHIDGKEITLVSCPGTPALLWTGTLTLTELRIQPKEKTLFPAFRTTFHPFALSHQFDALVGVGELDIFRFFLYFDDFLTSILREEDTWTEWMSQIKKNSENNPPAYGSTLAARVLSSAAGSKSES